MLLYLIILLLSITLFLLSCYEIASDVARKDNNYKHITTSHFEFQEASQFIHLKLPNDPVSGWIMKNVNFMKVCDFSMFVIVYFFQYYVDEKK